MKFLLHWILLLFAVLMLSTASRAQETSHVFSHVVLKLPFDYKSEEPWSKIINTPEEWVNFYSELLDENAADNTVISYVIPEIDFEAFRVVTGGIGFRPRGGHSATISEVIEMSDAVYIQVLVIKPGINCFVTANITYPSATILIRKSDKPIRFFTSELTQECPL